MVDNFETIKQLITFDDSEIGISLDQDSDAFYQVQLIKRKKDNPTMKGDCLVFKRYQIDKLSDLDKYYDEIIMMCNTFNLRAYFEVARKSYKQVTLDSLVELSQRVANNDFKKVHSIIDSCTSKYVNSSHKRWIVDIDDGDSDTLSLDELFEFYTEIISTKCRPGHTVIGKVPTKSGLHLITKPFDLKTFSKLIHEAGINKPIDELVKKKVSTILYCN